MTDFILPNLGENVPQGDVLQVLVKPGDRLAKDQPVLELETDKATLEVPSNVEGVVKDVRVKVGDKVKTGQVILTVDGASEATSASDRKAASPSTEKAPAPEKAEKAEKAGASIPAQKQEEGEEEAEKEGDKAAEPTAKEDARKRAPVVDFRGRQAPSAAPAAAATIPTVPSTASAPAAPSVRRVAREIGVDITQVTGSGPNGRITEEDVKTFARQILSSLGGGALAPTPASRPGGVPLPDFSKWERSSART